MLPKSPLVPPGFAPWFGCVFLLFGQAVVGDNYVDCVGMVFNKTARLFDPEHRMHLMAHGAKLLRSDFVELSFVLDEKNANSVIP